MHDEQTSDAAPDLRDGTITRVVRQKRNPERVSVFIDEAFAFGLTYDLAVQAGLRKGKPLTVSEQEALLADEETHRARAAALSYLSYQARTTTEIRRKLREKGFTDHVIEDAVAQMEAYGYLDDEAYARAYARGRFAGRGHGPQRIRTDLLRRGVAREVIDTILEELTETEDLREAALRHARKRWQSLAREADPRQRKKKAMDFLIRRGYAYDLVREVIEAVTQETE